MVKTIDGIGAVPIFVYLPEGGAITDRSEIVEGELFLFSYCQENQKVQCFSSRPLFVEKLKQGKAFKLTMHWDNLVHVTAAEAIYDY